MQEPIFLDDMNKAVKGDKASLEMHREALLTQDVVSVETLRQNARDSDLQLPQFVTVYDVVGGYVVIAEREGTHLVVALLNDTYVDPRGEAEQIMRAVRDLVRHIEA